MSILEKRGGRIVNHFRSLFHYLRTPILKVCSDQGRFGFDSATVRALAVAAQPYRVDPNKRDVLDIPWSMSDLEANRCRESRTGH